MNYIHIYVYVYLCTYIYIYYNIIYIYIYEYAYIYIYIYIYINTCICTYVKYLKLHTCYIYIYTFLFLDINTCAFACTRHTSMLMVDKLTLDKLTWDFEGDQGRNIACYTGLFGPIIRPFLRQQLSFYSFSGTSESTKEISVLG